MDSLIAGGGPAVARRDFIIKDTHRGLWYEDGVLVRVLEAGRYVVPWPLDVGFYRRPHVEVVLVDVRERDLTIKGFDKFARGDGREDG
jgi:hypothetical protein